MKKFFKFVGTLAALGAAVAGGIAVYKKYFAPEDDFDEFEDEFEDDFDEDLDVPKRSYVPLPPAEDAGDATEAAEDADDATEAAEDAGDATEAAEDAKESAE